MCVDMLANIDCNQNPSFFVCEHPPAIVGPTLLNIMGISIPYLVSM